MFNAVLIRTNANKYVQRQSPIVDRFHQAG